ncbi:MAG TPA: PAS domain S-box protein, partial [Candidatus Dormibacteraeota bacterium]|nr:PAS domain S-box protein [Candidatus Dormibacteraeota bacterium]
MTNKARARTNRQKGEREVSLTDLNPRKADPASKQTSGTANRRQNDSKAGKAGLRKSHRGKRPGKPTFANPGINLENLQAQEIELAAQNAELLEARADIDEALEQYTALFDFAPIGYFILNRGGLIENANLNGAALLGWDSNRLINQPFNRFVAAQDHLQLSSLLSGVWKNGGKQSCELRLLRKDRDVSFVHLEVVSRSGLPGKGKGCLLAAIDITAHREAEVALRSITEGLQHLVEERTAELRQRLRFEALTAELAGRLVNLPASEIDGAIGDAQRSVCTELGLQRSALFQVFEQEPGAMLLTHVYENAGHALPEGTLQKGNDHRLRSNIYWLLADEGPPPEYRRVDARELLPWTTQQLESGKRVLFSSLEELPPAAAMDRKVLQRYGTNSSLMVPLSAGGRNLGWMSFDCMRLPRKWSEAQITCVEAVGRVLAGALQRKRAEEALRQSEERLSMASEAAGAGLWRMHLESGEVWVTPRMRELLNFKPDEDLSFEKFVWAVHPDDRAQIILASQQTFETGAEMRVEHRVSLPDGSIRWVSGRGHRRCDETGKPIGLTGASVDITERKHAEEALRTSEARLEAGADLAGLGYYELNFDSRTCFVDHRFRQICGIPANKTGWELVQLWEENLHPDDVERVVQARQAFYEGRTDRFALEYRYRHPVRGETWIQHLCRITGRGEDGRVLRNFGAIRDITTRKLAEAALRESEAVNRATFEQAAVGIVHVGMDHRWLRVNDRLCAMLGYSREHLLLLDCDAINHPDDRQADLAQTAKLMAGEINTFSLEKRYLRKDRSVAWVKVAVSLVRTDSGEPKHFIGVIEDISERNLAEESLRTSEARLRAGADLAGLAYYELDFENQACYVDTRFQQLCDLPAGHQHGLDVVQLWADRLHPDDRQRVVDARAAFYLSKNDRFAIDYRYLHPTHGEKWFQHFSQITERFENGQARRTFGVVRDVTERLNAQQALRESEQRLRTVVENAGDGVQVVDDTGAIIDVNPARLGQMGYTREEMLKLTIFDVDPNVDREHFREGAETMQVGAAFRLETLNRRKDGSTFPVDVTASRILLGGRKCFLALIRDMTEHKQAEAEAERSRRELAHIGRVSTLGELAGGLAHEINQPLTSILSNAQAALRFLRASPPDLKEVHSILEDIVEDDRRAAEVIARIRGMMKKGKAEMVSVDLNTLIRETLWLVRSELTTRHISVTP